MNWTHDAKHAIRSGDWIIAAYNVSGLVRYVLWHGNNCEGFFESTDDAKAAAEAAQ